MSTRRECTVVGCPSAAKSLGWCPKHYGRWKRNGDPTALSAHGLGRKPIYPAGSVCTAPQCARILTGRGEGHGMCTKHYQRIQRTGTLVRTQGRATCTLPNCDKPVVGRGWCSAHWTNWQRYGTAEISRTCPICSLDFEVTAHNRRYCGSECRLVGSALTSRSASSLRRARIRSTQVLKFDPVEVFVRDAWVCGLCSVAIEPTLRWPEPYSPSLDHVVPLARGGSHSFENTQASHLVCNMKKGARTMLVSA